MAELLGVVERAYDQRTITAREHTTERRLNRMPVIDMGDPDALAFIAAAGLTNPMHLDAVENLATDLKDAGVWSKMHAIWPFVGGSTFAHKWNLKDPRDLDAAFRLTFNGSWAHSSDGVLPSSAYADTHLVPASVLSSSSGSMGIYSRTAGGLGGTPYDLSASNGADTEWCGTIARYSTGNAYFGFGSSSYPCNVAVADGSGLFATNRLSPSDLQGIRNGSSIQTAADTYSLPSFSLYLGASNKGGTVSYYGARQYAFAFVGDGLTGVEHAALYNAVQAFQTTLGRAV